MRNRTKLDENTTNKHKPGEIFVFAYMISNHSNDMTSRGKQKKQVETLAWITDDEAEFWTVKIL
jgi:hypothetical protein